MPITHFPHGVSSFGVPVFGGGASRGLVAYRKVYFVDGDNGSDSNPGLSLDRAFATIQKGADSLRTQDALLVIGHQTGGDYDETVTTRQLDDTTQTANYCTIMGLTNTRFSYNSPQIFPNTGDGECFTLRAPGYRISGFRLAAGDTSAVALVSVAFAQAARTADTNYSPGTQIDNCELFGRDKSGYGIKITGAPPTCVVLDNRFIAFSDSCIRFPQSPSIAAQKWLIQGNYFYDVKWAIASGNANAGFQNCMIIGNYIATSGLANTLLVGIDTSTGQRNLITQNYLGGGANSYTNGVVYPTVGSNNDWSGNITTDDGATNILADTPWTQGPPG